MKLVCGSLQCFAIAILFLPEKTLLVSGALRTYPKNEIAIAGDSVVFPCSTDLQYPLHWLHTPVGTHDLNDVYFHGKIVRPYLPRFQVQKDESRGVYNLSISSVQQGDAGTYTCIDKTGRGIQREAELVVLGSALVGRSNTSLDPLTICGDQTVIILLTCGVNYTGNIPPELNWKQTTIDGLVISHADTSVVKHSNGVDCSVKLRANLEMDGSVFVCEASTEKYNWKSDSVNVLYASNTTLKETYTSPTSINCMANSNGFCNYVWTREDSDESIVSSKSSTGTLDLDHLGYGQYQCSANCDLGGFKCEVLPHLVEYRSDEPFHEDRNHSAIVEIKSKTAIVIAAFVIVVAVVALAVLMVYLHTKRSHTNHTQSHERPNSPTDHSSPILLSTTDSIGLFKKFTGRDRSIKHAPNQKKSNTDHSSATLLSKQYSLGLLKKFRGQDSKTTFTKPSSGAATSSSDLIKLKLRDTIHVGDFQPHGIVNYNDKFYVVSSSHNAVIIFEDVAPYRRLEDFVIKDMEGPMSLDLSWKPLCFYIPDRTRKCIWKVRGLDGKLEADEWMHNLSKPFQLSVMRNGDVLIPVWPAAIMVFDSNSRPIRKINLGKDVLEPYHAVEMSSGSIVVSHGDVNSNLHRVFLINTDGKVVWSYGNEKGSGEDQLYKPHHMVLDEKDRVYISDQANMRIVVLDKNGQRLACVKTEMLITFRSFYVQKNRSLFVGGYGSILCYGIEESV